jgi:hypothetical protein
MNFPRTEGNVVILANEMVGGLTTSAQTYPAPPIEPTDLSMLNNTFKNAQNALTAAQAAVSQAAETKLTALGYLVEAMKKDIQYAEMTVGNDDPKLKLIGWGARREPTPLQVPGPAQFLTANPQGEGWVLLEWQKPLEGGKPSAYKVQRRKRTEGVWDNVGTANVCEINLVNQERKIEWEYSIVATNKAGDALISNTVMVVL